MPGKYHIETKPVPPRLPRIGRCGVVDWREDCAGCHNCVKKACVFDRYRQENQYIGGLTAVDTLFFECMGCFSCVQKCTKGILALAANPAYEKLGSSYWTPEVIETTWTQAETAKIPVSGAGYRGKFTGAGFDSMWTDMSEIVRPTRDGIHGREYINTSVDIGRKPAYLSLDGDGAGSALQGVVDIPMPIVIDMLPAPYDCKNLLPIMAAVAARTGILAIMDYADYGLLGAEGQKLLPNLAFHVAAGAAAPPTDVLRQTRLVEIPDGQELGRRVEEVRRASPQTVIAIRVPLDGRGVERAIELGQQPCTEVIHLVADLNGNQVGVREPRFVKDMVLEVHRSLVKSGHRDGITIMAGGGIALAEHMAKQIICGADVVTIDLPLLVALECRLCAKCDPVSRCPARITEVNAAYGVGRMTNLIVAWHDQLIEMMGAMGIREARRLRGETGRAMFFEELEEETFGRLFGARKRA
jgi:ferredoxin